MKINQKGFSSVDILLVIIIIILLGIVGWLMYTRQNKDAPKTLQTTQQTQKELKTAENTDKKSTIAKEIKYFDIKELGIKFELPATLNGLYYTLGNNGRTAYFSLKELKNTDCAAEKTAQIALSRYTDADYEEDIQAANSKASAKKIGNYYFNTSSGQAMCADEGSANQDKVSNMKSELVKILPSALVLIN